MCAFSPDAEEDEIDRYDTVGNVSQWEATATHTYVARRG